MLLMTSWVEWPEALPEVFASTCWAIKVLLSPWYQQWLHSGMPVDTKISG